MTLIEQWRQELEATHRTILKDFGLEVFSEEKLVQVLDGLQDEIESVLRDGLDIGGIVKYVVPVELSKHPEHGWVFVKQDGEMFPIKRYL